MKRILAIVLSICLVSVLFANSFTVFANNETVVLEYQDYYDFAVEGDKAGYTYTSSDSTVLKMNVTFPTYTTESRKNSGDYTVHHYTDGPSVGHAVSVGNATVTVKNSSGNTVRTVNVTVNKARVCLTLITGQSNNSIGLGYPEEIRNSYKTGDYTKYTGDYTAPTSVYPGTVFHTDGNVLPVHTIERYDVGLLTPINYVNQLGDTEAEKIGTKLPYYTYGYGGYQPALGQKWYSETGEKVFFVNAAVGATALNQWAPSSFGDVIGRELTTVAGDTTSNGTTYTSGSLYMRAVSMYQNARAMLINDPNIEIVREIYYWNQGESDEVTEGDGQYTINSSQMYYEAYKAMHEGFKRDLGITAGGIIMVRCNTISILDESGYNTADSSKIMTQPRKAQYLLCNDIDDLYLVDTTMELMSGKDMSPQNGPHCNQVSYNTIGKTAAENMLKSLNLISADAQHSIEFLNGDGLKITESEVIIPESGAIIIPRFTALGSTDSMTITVTGNFRTDKCGKITATEKAVSGDSGKLTVVSKNGLKAELNLYYLSKTTESTTEVGITPFADFDNCGWQGSAANATVVESDSNRFGKALTFTIKEAVSHEYYAFCDKTTILHDKNALVFWIENNTKTNGTYKFGLREWSASSPSNGEFFKLNTSAQYYLIDKYGNTTPYNAVSNNITVPAGFSGFVAMPLDGFVYAYGTTENSTDYYGNKAVDLEYVTKFQLWDDQTSNGNYPTTITLDEFAVVDSITAFAEYQAEEAFTPIALTPNASVLSVGEKIRIATSSTAKIYYTLDNTVPNENSLLYDGGIVPTAIGNLTVKAIAIENDGTKSEVITLNYTVVENYTVINGLDNTDSNSQLGSATDANFTVSYKPTNVSDCGAYITVGESVGTTPYFTLNSLFGKDTYAASKDAIAIYIKMPNIENGSPTTFRIAGMPNYNYYFIGTAHLYSIDGKYAENTDRDISIPNGFEGYLIIDLKNTTKNRNNWMFTNFTDANEGAIMYSSTYYTWEQWYAKWSGSLNGLSLQIIANINQLKGQDIVIDELGLLADVETFTYSPQPTHTVTYKGAEIPTAEYDDGTVVTSPTLPDGDKGKFLGWSEYKNVSSVSQLKPTSFLVSGYDVVLYPIYENDIGKLENTNSVIINGFEGGAVLTQRTSGDYAAINETPSTLSFSHKNSEDSKGVRLVVTTSGSSKLFIKNRFSDSVFTNDYNLLAVKIKSKKGVSLNLTAVTETEEYAINSSTTPEKWYILAQNDAVAKSTAYNEKIEIPENFDGYLILPLSDFEKSLTASDLSGLRILTNSASNYELDSVLLIKESNIFFDSINIKTDNTVSAYISCEEDKVYDASNTLFAIKGNDGNYTAYEYCGNRFEYTLYNVKTGETTVIINTDGKITLPKGFIGWITLRSEGFSAVTNSYNFTKENSGILILDKNGNITERISLYSKGSVWHQCLQNFMDVQRATVYGDFNTNGTIDVTDIVTIKRHLLDTVKANTRLADVNLDCVIDIRDLIAAKSILAN